MTKPTQPAAEPKKRRSIDERIRELQLKKDREQLTVTTREALSAIRQEMREKRYRDAMASSEILTRALAELAGVADEEAAANG